MDPASRAQNFATRQHDLQPDHVVARHSVLQTTRSARIRRHVASHTAIFLARRIRRIKKFLFPRSRLQLGRDHARLHDRDRIGEADLLDPIHPRQRKRNPPAHRHATAHVAKPRTPRRHRNFFLRREPEQLAHIFRRAREDNDLRRMIREPFIAAVRF